MKAERWREIDAVFQVAPEREPAARSRFLDEACVRDITSDVVRISDSR